MNTSTAVMMKRVYVFAKFRKLYSNVRNLEIGDNQECSELLFYEDMYLKIKPFSFCVDNFTGI